MERYAEQKDNRIAELSALLLQREREAIELKRLIETIEIMADGGKTDAYAKLDNIRAIIYISKPENNEQETKANS